MATTKNIQAVERALQILEVFQKGNKELGVKEIADATGLHKSTAFGLIHTLSNYGYLKQNDENQKFAMGLKILSLANAVQKNNLIVQVTRPYLQTLSEKFQETCHCAIEENGAAVYVDKVEVVRSIYINSQIGSKNYLHCTGVGKSILAFLPRVKKEKFLQVPLKSLTYNTITDPDSLRKELEKICIQGYAVDDEEIEIGLYCVSVPILNRNRNSIAAISMSGPTARMREINQNQLIADMKTVALEVEKELNL